MKNIVLAALLSAGGLAQAATATTPTALLPGVYAHITPAFDPSQTPPLPQILYGEQVKAWRWLPQSDSKATLATALQAELAERGGLKTCQAITNEIWSITSSANLHYDVQCDDQHVFLTITPSGRQ